MSSLGLGKKYKNEKQVQAVVVNIKEQQNLIRAYETLRLEESHVLKLLRLDYVQAKARQRLMESRVSKIRSHLSAEDIAEMRILESEGRLPCKPTRASTSALVIESAARRLKLWSSATSARMCRRSSTAETPRARAQTQARATAPSERSRSVAVRRRESSTSNGTIVDVGASSTPMTPVVRRSNSIHFGAESSERGRLAARSLTANCRVNNSRFHSAAGGADRQRPKTSVIESYSSHDAHRFSMDGTGAKRGALLPTSMADAKARDRADDRRRELLVDEQSIADHLEKRRMEFLRKTDEWVQENPPFAAFDPVEVARGRHGAGSAEPSALNSELGDDDALHDSTVNDVWKDLRKCRYLRTDESQADLSGINTMASEQMNLYQTMTKSRKV